MPSHHYSRVTTVEDVDEHDFPTFSPPSLQSATTSSGDLPHKNDDTATIKAQSEREKNPMDEPALLDVSTKGESEDHDLEAVREGACPHTEQMQKRWMVGVVVFVVWFSGTVVYGVARSMCIKKS